MVDSSHSNTENELSLDSSSSLGVNIEGDNKVVYSDEETEKKHALAQEKDEKVSGIPNPITVTDGGEKGEKEEKAQNGKVPKEKQNIKFENMNEKPYEKYAKFFYLGLANVFVVMVFFLPLIFYYTDQPGDTTLINIPLDLDTCTATVSHCVCMCACVHVHACVCLCTCEGIHMCVYICGHVCICVCMCAYVCACVHMYVHVCMNLECAWF